MNVVIVAPIENSLYSLLVTELAAQEPGVRVTGIVLRRILDWRRISSEYRRDGPRLLRKIWSKLIRNNIDQRSAGPELTLEALARDQGLPERRLSQLARRRCIPLHRTRRFEDSSVIAFLRRAEPDVVLFTGGGLLRKDFLAASGGGVFNVHMGILPPYRGMDVVEWPFLETKAGDDAQVGLTLHLMDQGLDTGDILRVRQVSARTVESFTALRRRLGPMMVELMIAGLRDLRDGKMQPAPQKLQDGRQYFVMHPRLKEIATKRFHTWRRHCSAPGPNTVASVSTP